MEEAYGRADFTSASSSDAVYFRGFNGRPEFVVKDHRRVCIVSVYKCDPRSGACLQPLDAGARAARLQWAQNTWSAEQIRHEAVVDKKGRRFENAMERIERRGRPKKRDRKRINKIFKEFAGGGRTINRAQLYSLLCAVGMPPENNGGAMQAIFEEFDANGNGKIGKREFRKALIRRAKHSDFEFESDESDDSDS